MHNTIVMEAEINYSDRYSDDNFTYRHVILSGDARAKVPRRRLMTEEEWRKVGVQQSRGWEHYAIHRPEPWVLLFRRPLEK